MTNIDIEYLQIYASLRDIGLDSLMWREQLLRSLHQKLALARLSLTHIDLNANPTGGSGYRVTYPQSILMVGTRKRSILNNHLASIPFDAGVLACLEKSRTQKSPFSVCSGNSCCVSSTSTFHPHLILILQFETPQNAHPLPPAKVEELQYFLLHIAESQGRGFALPTTPSPSLLPPKRKDVFELLIAGKTDAEIAEQLDIAVDTVRGHIKTIFKHFNASSRLKLMALFQGHFVHRAITTQNPSQITQVTSAK